MRQYLAAAAIVAASIALREAMPIMAIANAATDDLLFVRLASSLRSGDWLGAYDNLTLAKGAAYPAFIALNSLTGIPLKLTEHVFYLTACCAFAWSMGRLFGSRAAALGCLAILAFNPLAWAPDSGGRVMREGLYASLGLWMLALAVHLFVPAPASSSWPGSRERRVWTLAALGATGAAYWLTREEGAWLVPSMAILVGASLVRAWRADEVPVARVRLRAAALELAVPLAAFAAIVGAVNAVNYAKYGVFRNNDFRSREFPQAYGALSRILHEQPRPYVLFPADARAKAYRVSPAARELAPVFEGVAGNNWRQVGCWQTGTNPCPEILAGWLMWALRDAVAAAGHYTSAHASRSFYRTLAREVNGACDRGEIACGPRNDSMVPPWRPEYLGRIAGELWRTSVSLARLGGMDVRMKASIGTPEQRAFFARLTHDAQASDEDARVGLRGWRMHAADLVAKAYVSLLPVALTAALAGWIVLLAVSWKRRRWHAGHWVAAALAAAAAMRVALLAVLAATSIPANDVLYLTPVAPMALALVPCVIFLAVDLFFPGKLHDVP